MPCLRLYQNVKAEIKTRRISTGDSTTTITWDIEKKIKEFEVCTALIDKEYEALKAEMNEEFEANMAKITKENEAHLDEMRSKKNTIL
jgi:hypothetical protein